MDAANATADGDDRARWRDRAGVTAGAFSGAVIGVVAGAFAWPSMAALVGAAGALAGGVAGRLLAERISPDEWDPTWEARSYVGTKSADDDITED